MNLTVIKNNALALSVFTLFISSCITTALEVKDNFEFDKRLLGKWQSDRIKTLQWINKNRKLTQKQINKLDNTIKFGTLTLEISERKTRITYDGQTCEEKNKIIGTVSDSIAVVVNNPITNQDEIRIIRIENEDTYSIYTDCIDIREYFKKIN